MALVAVLAGLIGLVTAGTGSALAAPEPAAVHRQTASTTSTTLAPIGSTTTTTVAGAAQGTAATVWVPGIVSTSTIPAPTGPGSSGVVGTTGSTGVVGTTSTTTASSGSTGISGSTTPRTTVPAWTATVPGPPPAPVVTASPADIARADQLEQQITAQSEVLDVLAGQYDADEEKLTAATTQTQQLTAQLADADVRAKAAQATVVRQNQSVRQVAVDAYVDLHTGSPNGTSGLVNTYENGVGLADAQTALGKAMDELRQLHQEQAQLQAAETAISNETQQAAIAQSAAQTAATQAQAAAQNATTQQAQLLGLVNQVSGSLAPLVTAAQDAANQAAFQRFSTANNLEFAPSGTLSAPLPQTINAVKEAEAEVGKPYQWGATGPASFDCSGLMMWAWSQVDVSIPRVAAQQQAWATPVPISQLEPGDLVFFGSPAYHVGMYIGGGLMVDAPHTGADVQVQSIWWDSLSGFGRIHKP